MQTWLLSRIIILILSLNIYKEHFQVDFWLDVPGKGFWVNKSEYYEVRGEVRYVYMEVRKSHFTVYVMWDAACY
jgi:hypothetical protein